MTARDEAREIMRKLNHPDLGQHYDDMTYFDIQLDLITQALEKRGAIISAKDREIERLKSATHCAYCGEEFPLDTVTADQVDEHIHRCPKHPIAVYRAEIESLRSNSSALASELVQTNKHIGELESKLAEAEKRYEHYFSEIDADRVANLAKAVEALKKIKDMPCCEDGYEVAKQTIKEIGGEK